MLTKRYSKTFFETLQKRYLPQHQLHYPTQFSRKLSTTVSYSNINLIQNYHYSNNNIRSLSSYASVKHDVEYKNEMDSHHGEQLKLALLEAQKYEKEDIDPFEVYKIGNDIEDDEDNEDNEEIIEDGEDVDMIEEEDFEEEDDDDEIIDEGMVISNYMNNGQLRRTKAELIAFKVGSPAGGKFAIIDLNGSQQKVTVDDVVIVNKLKPVEKWAIGSTHTLNATDGQVLLLGSQEKTLVGLPFVNGAEVDVMVEEITRDKKVIVFKKKRRKNYRRKNGFKREVTFLRVLDIRFP